MTAPSPISAKELAVRTLPLQGRHVVRFLGAALALFGAVVVAAHFFRPALEHMGARFTDRFGYLGMAIGSFLADGFHLPLPPTFYMLTAVTSGRSMSWTMFAIMGGSLSGGAAGYLLSSVASRWRWLERRMRRSQPRVREVLQRHGLFSLAIAGLSPVPFSMTCYFAGFYRLGLRTLLTLLALRIPRLWFFYAVVSCAWSWSGPS